MCCKGLGGWPVGLGDWEAQLLAVKRAVLATPQGGIDLHLVGVSHPQQADIEERL